MDKFDKAYSRLQGKARSILEITVRREKDKVFILREGKQIWFNKKKLATEDYCLAKSAKNVGYLDKVHVAADGEVLDGVHRLLSDPSWPLQWHPEVINEEKKIQLKIDVQFKRRKNTDKLNEIINRMAKIRKATGKYEPGEYAEDIANELGFTSQYIRKFLDEAYKAVEKRNKPCETTVSHTDEIEDEEYSESEQSKFQGLSKFKIRQIKEISQDHGLPEKDVQEWLKYPGELCRVIQRLYSSSVNHALTKASIDDLMNVLYSKLEEIDFTKQSEQTMIYWKYLAREWYERHEYEEES